MGHLGSLLGDPPSTENMASHLLYLKTKVHKEHR